MAKYLMHLDDNVHKELKHLSVDNKKSLKSNITEALKIGVKVLREKLESEGK